MGAIGLLTVVAVSGCAPALTKHITWAPYTTYDAPELSDLVGEGRPVELFAEDPAPFHGWLLAPNDWRRIQEEFRRILEEKKRLEDQMRGDRAFASTVDREKVSALVECRRSVWRSFAFGIGVGAGACAAADRAIDEATR